MNPSFKLIARGLLIASLGFIATVLLILGLSSAFIGRWIAALSSSLASAAAFSLFHRWLDPYLTRLEQRFDPSPSPTDLTE